MAKFRDAFTGETRELNIQPVRRKQEQRPMTDCDRQGHMWDVPNNVCTACGITFTQYYNQQQQANPIGKAKP